MNHAAIVFLLSSASVISVEIEPTPIGRWPTHMRGAVSAMAVQGEHLCFSAGRDLVIADILNSAIPKVLGVYRGTATITSVAVSGDYAFIAEPSSQRIRIVDIANPLSPQSVATRLSTTFARSVALSGNLLYVGGVGGVEAFDISAPTDPVAYAKATSVAVSGLAAAGTICFAAGPGGVKVLDFSNPSAPIPVKTVVLNSSTTGVAIKDNYLYTQAVASAIFDITDPLNPTFLGNGIVGLYLSVLGDRALSATAATINYWDIADPLSIRSVNSLDAGYPVQSIVLDGERSFAGTIAGVHTLNAPVDGPVSQIGFLDTDGVAAAMARSDSFVLVADGKAGMRIIDAADPRTPKVVSTYHLDAGGEARDIAVQGRMAYLTTDTGFQFIDFSTPAAPSLVGSIAAAFPVTFAVSGDYGYMSTFGDDLTVIDIRNPSNVKPLTTITNAKYIKKLKIGEHFAIGCRGNEGTVVLDFSKPEQPTIISTLESPFLSWDAEFVGDYAFVSCGTLYRMDLKTPGFAVTAIASHAGLAVAHDGNRLVATSELGLNVFDITSVLSPVHIGSYGQPATAARINSALVIGSFAVTAAGAESIQFLDLTPRSNPQSIARLSGDRIESIDAQGDLIGARTSNGNLLLYDRQIPSQPRLISTLSVAPGVEFGGVAFAGNTVYYGAGGIGVAVIDIADPLQPIRINTFDTPGSPAGLLADQNKLYVCDSSQFMTFDITDRMKPSLVGAVAIPAVSCTIVGTHAFVAAGTAGLYVVDISSPTIPRVVGRFNSPDAAREVAVIGNIALLADRLSLAVVDISDLSVPRPVRTLPYKAQSIAVSSKYAYIADQATGLNVFDITEASNPIWISGNSAFESMERVRIHNNHILAAGLQPSLTILPLYGALPPEISLLSPVTSGANLRLRIRGTSGTNIRVQKSAELPTWSDWMALTLDGSVMEIEDSGALSTSGSAFYRAVTN
jgi:hypothetical protein